MMRAASTFVQAQKRRDYCITIAHTMRNFHRSVWVAAAIAFSRTETTDASFSHSPPRLPPPAAFATIIRRSQSQRSRSSHRIRQQTLSSTQFYSGREAPPDFSIDDDDELSAAPGNRKRAPRPDRTRRPPIRAVISAGEASWMDRNAQFSGEQPQQKQKRAESQQQESGDSKNRKPSKRSRSTVAPAPKAPHGDGPAKSFREDFRGTRVFVSGLPEDCSWQTLKDHFRTAGEVVFASVSVDSSTGRSKGHGIVQFETTEQAANAIAIMRSHPLKEHTLFVRPDLQEDTASSGENRRLTLTESRKGPTPPSKWKCANSQEDAAALFANGERHRAIMQMLKARDQARFRRNYAAADTMREELKREYGVHIDDRYYLWWTTVENNKVPEAIRDLNGEGRWGAAPAWRWIPSTPESDACVDPDLVEGLLKQRDVARREKDFATADRLLEQARTAPDNDLTLRIHDESRTWRVWTPEPPPAMMMNTHDDDRRRPILSPEEECLEIVREHEPEKLNEVRTLLAKFPGREYNILRKIKQRYLQN